MKKFSRKELKFALFFYLIIHNERGITIYHNGKILIYQTQHI